MPKLKLLVVLFIVVINGSLAHAQHHDALPYYDSTWSQPTEPFRIAGNIYYVGTYDLACYLVTTPHGHALINTGLAESVPMIQKNIEALGFKFSDIKILLTTQVHYDHVAGMAEVKRLTGAQMYVNEADAQVLADGGDSDFIFGGKGTTFTPVKPDRLLHNNDEVKIGDTKLIVLHHPGHTKGSTSYLINTRDEKRSWKVLIANMPSILSSTNLKGMPAYPNVGKDYAQTFKSMKALQFDIWVASHASQFDLHKKRITGAPYNPEVFNDRSKYDAILNDIQLDYNKRIQAKQ